MFYIFVFVFLCFFFFSSRRRHTRSTRDWSSDVCSSDLRPAFMIRAVLAATFSSVYGIYSGFELCENAASPGREEYLDSEKYQFKERDWDEIGRASCRERVKSSEVAVEVEKKETAEEREE